MAQVIDLTYEVIDLTYEDEVILIPDDEPVVILEDPPAEEEAVPMELIPAVTPLDPIAQHLDEMYRETWTFNWEL